MLKTLSRKSLATATAAAALSAVAALGAFAQPAAQHEITVTVTHVKALDKLDAFSKADFFARATIAGTAVDSAVAKQNAEIKPNWKLSRKVAPGVHNITLEIFDKDLTKNEPIDINPVDKKRKLDFTVDTRNCRMTGLSGVSRCTARIVRGGKENKKAQVTFGVSVKK
jgi:hypothetical protein